jgi:hypothetical protein
LHFWAFEICSQNLPGSIEEGGVELGEALDLRRPAAFD